MLERDYQAQLIKKVKKLLPSCVILKNDSSYLQGVPDLTIFYHNRWAMLEVKLSADSSQQPNQDYYVELMNELSYAAFIYPENEEDILNELQHALDPRRTARFSQR